MLFEKVLSNWVLWIYFLLIVFASHAPVRFLDKVLKPNRWWRNLRYHVQELPRPFRWIGGFILFVSVTLTIYLTAPILWVFMIPVDAREKRLNGEKARCREEENRKERERLEVENSRRAEGRKQWLSENRPKLYFNTVDGVTAVLRPADYEAAKEETQRDQIDGLWKADDEVLCLARNTFIFTTQQADEQIESKVRGSSLDRYIPGRIAGWRSELTKIVKEGNIELIWVAEIFVPFINEAKIPFNKQYEILSCCPTTCLQYELVERQAPAELQPI